MLKYILGLCLCLSVAALAAQGAEVNDQFAFADGLYYTHDDFRQNRPSEPLSRLGVEHFQLDFDENLLFWKDQHQAPLVDSIWGLTVDGVPYMRVRKRLRKGERTVFVRLQVVGNICYFYYQSMQDTIVQMNIYNPVTGGVVASKPVRNHHEVTYRKMLRFETGETAPFEPHALMKWVAEDRGLYRTLADMNAKETEKRLFKSLLIFNDRNKVYIPEQKSERR